MMSLEGTCGYLNQSVVHVIIDKLSEGQLFGTWYVITSGVYILRVGVSILLEVGSPGLGMKA